MDLESESSVLNNEAITTISVSDRTSNGDETKVPSNEYCVVKNNELSTGKGIEVVGPVSMPPVEVQKEVSPFPAVKKGRVLKKWRRIKREVNKGADNRVDSRRNLTKGMQFFFTERKQNSWGVLLKSGTGGSSGKKLDNSLQHGQKGNGRVEISKKARGKQIKIEKENSHFSLESDCRSSNFIFMQGNVFATSNGSQSGRSLHYEGGNSDELHTSERQAYNRKNDGGFEDVSREDTINGSSWEVRGERNENHGSTDLDPLVQSIYTLQSAKEALEKEVLKFREVGTLDGAFKDLPSDFTSNNLKLELKEAANREYTGTELEDLFRLKIEAEVEYLAISVTVQKLRVASVDQINVLQEKTTLASDQALMLNMLENTKNKASMLKKEAEKLVNSFEDITCADENLKLQMGICKYTSCFLVQLVMLVLVLGFFIFHISQNYAGVVPT